MGLSIVGSDQEDGHGLGVAELREGKGDILSGDLQTDERNLGFTWRKMGKVKGSEQDGHHPIDCL